MLDNLTSESLALSIIVSFGMMSMKNNGSNNNVNLRKNEGP